MCKIITGETYGYQLGAWECAKKEAIQAIVAQARKGLPIFYSDLTKHIRSISFGPHDYAFHHLLGEISKEEDAAGRGMLSVLVVHKDDGMPGSGFFDLALKGQISRTSYAAINGRSATIKLWTLAMQS
jgi:hypothetical protein